MTISDFEVFENTFFAQLKSNNKECLKTILKENKIVEYYLNKKNISYIKKFVNDFNEIVLDPNTKKYKLCESVLKRNSFSDVLDEFRESDVLIRACKNCNKKAIEWLFTMNINYEIQDSLGMTALMHAAEHGGLDFAVEKMMKKNGKHVQLNDNNGNNVYFHATSSPDILKKLLKYGDHGVFHINNDNENILLYCSRYNKMRSFEILDKKYSFNSELTNSVGKNIPMYLVENARFNELRNYDKKYSIDPNYKNKFGDCLVSVFMKKYYQQCSGNVGDAKFASNYNYVIIKNYANTLRYLVEMRCNFNVTIDEDGNTAYSVLEMMGDMVSLRYISKHAYINSSTKSNYRQNGKNSYPVPSEYIDIIQNWVLEVLYPNEVKNVSLCKNSHRKDDPNSFSGIMHKLNTVGLGTY